MSTNRARRIWRKLGAHRLATTIFLTDILGRTEDRSFTILFLITHFQIIACRTVPWYHHCRYRYWGHQPLLYWHYSLLMKLPRLTGSRMWLYQEICAKNGHLENEKMITFHSMWSARIYGGRNHLHVHSILGYTWPPHTNLKQYHYR